MKTKTKNLTLAILVLVVASSIPALIFGKWLEAIIFNICHLLIRQQFEKQYHHIMPAMCRMITALVMFFGVSFVLPLELSLMSAIPINYFISWIGFVKKTSDDFEVKCNNLEEKVERLIKELKEYKNIDLYKMTEEQLRQYA